MGFYVFVTQLQQFLDYIVSEFVVAEGGDFGTHGFIYFGPQKLASAFQSQLYVPGACLVLGPLAHKAQIIKNLLLGRVDRIVVNFRQTDILIAAVAGVLLLILKAQPNSQANYLRVDMDTL
jgi:uncharacterized protein YheU (UPF0270 family)